jgi:hypothetical protein
MATVISIADVTSNVVVSSDGKYTVSGTGILDDLMETINTHLVAQYDANRISSTELAEIYANVIPSIVSTAVNFTIQQKVSAAQVDNLLKDGALKDEQLRGMVRKYTEDDEKWVISKAMMENQKAMSDIDLFYKEPMSANALTQSEKTIESMEVDIAFNTSKREVMEFTRKDNVRMKATEQYAEFLKYISAADVVPGDHHFENLVQLVTSINEGIEFPDTVYTLQSKPVDKTNTVTKGA